MKKKIIAIILARGGSKEIKNKNIIKINNKQLIFWSIKSCLLSKLIDETWVSSESNKILNISEKYGAKILKRPKKYAKDNSSSESAWLHAIKHIDKNNFVKTIIGIQPTSPLRPKKCLDEAIIKFKKEKLDSLFSSQKIKDHFIWKNKKKKLVPNYNYRKRKIRQNIKEKYLENGSFFIFDKRKFLINKCRFFGKIGTYPMGKIFSFQIDKNEDIKLFQNLKKYFK